MRFQPGKKTLSDKFALLYFSGEGIQVVRMRLGRKSVAEPREEPKGMGAWTS